MLEAGKIDFFFPSIPFIAVGSQTRNVKVLANRLQELSYSFCVECDTFSILFNQLKICPFPRTEKILKDTLMKET